MSFSFRYLKISFLLLVFQLVGNGLLLAASRDSSGYYVSKAFEFLFTDPALSVSFGQKAAHLAAQNGNGKAEADAYGVVGMAYYYLNDYENVNSAYRKMAQSISTSGDFNRLSMTPSLLLRLRQSELSIGNLQKSLALHRKNGDKEKMAQVYAQLGDVYRNILSREQAMNCYRRAFSIYEQMKSTKLLKERSVLLGSLGDLFMAEEKFDSALICFERQEFIFNKLSDQVSLANNLYNKAEVYLRLGDEKVAGALLNQALEMNIRLNDHLGAAQCLQKKGILALKLNRDQEALDCFGRSNQLAKLMGASLLLRDNYAHLATIHAQQGNYAEAYRLRLLYSGVNNELLLEENAAQMVSSLALQELQKKEQENEMLRTKNENYRLRLERETLANWRLSLGLLVIAALLVGILIYYRYWLKRNENVWLESKISEALHEQQKQQQIIMHQANLTSLGELAAGIAHEINQPVQNISLTAESLQEELVESQASPMVRKWIQELFVDVERIRHIVDHIRIFSSGQREEVEERFRVSECIERALSLHRAQLANHRIDLHVACDGGCCVSGNPHKLEQVIHNLVNNARNAVEAKAAREEDFQPAIWLRLFCELDRVVVEVADNGIGIEPSRRAEIFLPFVTSRINNNGTGLGLSISLGIVKEMGGVIEVDDNQPSGTIMRVVLPKAHDNGYE